MNIKHITSDSLRRLLNLTDKKEQLIKSIQDVENEIARTLLGAATTVVEAAESVVPAKSAKRKGGRKKSKKSGGLKARVLSLLEAAGDQGLRVKDIADKLGSTPGNISVWFSTTGKKLTNKIEPGRYAIKGSSTKTSQAGKPAKAKKKSKMSPEGRAKIAAMMKARWEARRAGKAAPKKAAAPKAKRESKPAKKKFKLPKAK